ncbi:hypothetical protein SALBM311S_01450 [Streptomyces alboniger]
MRKLLLLGTGLRGGDPTSDPQVPDHALNPVHVLENFLFLFFGRSEAAIEAGRAFWERRHQRADQDTPASPAAQALPAASSSTRCRRRRAVWRSR